MANNNNMLVASCFHGLSILITKLLFIYNIIEFIISSYSFSRAKINKCSNIYREMFREYMSKIIPAKIPFRIIAFFPPHVKVKSEKV